MNSTGRACLADFGLSAISDSATNSLIPHWTSHSSLGSKGGSIRWQAPELFGILGSGDDSAEDEDEDEGRTRGMGAGAGRATGLDVSGSGSGTGEEEEKGAHNTKASDVYAYACVCYEIYTGKMPFWDVNRESAVIVRVCAGMRPARPLVGEGVWSGEEVVGEGGEGGCGGGRGKGRLTEEMWEMMERCWSRNSKKRMTIGEVRERLASVVGPILGLEREREEEGVVAPAQFRQEMVGKEGFLPLLARMEMLLSGQEGEGDEVG